MQKSDIEHLATLARIELTPEEIEAFTQEIGGVLGYVGTITEITGDAPPAKVVGALNSVMREDTDAHEPGVYTEDLLNAAPQRHGAYVMVKKILEQK